MKTHFFKNGSKRPYTIVQPPSGTIMAYAGSSAPSGWLLCEGQEVSKTTYAALNDVCGTTYGANTNGSGGAGSTHFRLPDLRQRAPIGAGTGSGLTARTIGGQVGSNSVKLDATQSGFPTHSHSITESNHTHTVATDSHSHQYGTYLPGAAKSGTGANLSYFGTPSAASTYPTKGPSESRTFTVSKNTSNITDGSGNANVVGYTQATAESDHPSHQPSLVVNYIIKT